MREARAGGEHPHRDSEARGDPRFEVYGVWTVIRMGGADATPYAVQCPKGQPIQYGTVVCRGDGFDPVAETFRDMPPLGAVVAFEETAEGIEGHYFFVGDDEYRILHVDAINIAFPGQES
jgi:hypothetical protein